MTHTKSTRFENDDDRFVKRMPPLLYKEAGWPEQGFPPPFQIYFTIKIERFV